MPLLCIALFPFMSTLHSSSGSNKKSDDATPPPNTSSLEFKLFFFVMFFFVFGKTRHCGERHLIIISQLDFWFII